MKYLTDLVKDLIIKNIIFETKYLELFGIFGKGAPAPFPDFEKISRFQSLKQV
jgi:hypothetical protein